MTSDLKKGCGKEFMWIASLNDKRICGQIEDLKHSDNILLCPECRKSSVDLKKEIKNTLMKRFEIYCRSCETFGNVLVGVYEKIIKFKCSNCGNEFNISLEQALSSQRDDEIRFLEKLYSDIDYEGDKTGNKISNVDLLKYNCIRLPCRCILDRYTDVIVLRVCNLHKNLAIGRKDG